MMEIHKSILATLCGLAFVFCPLYEIHAWQNTKPVVEAPQGEKGKANPTTQSKGRPTTFWPDDVQWDEAIPTPKSHLGFDIGFRHLEHWQVVSYLKAIAEASDRVQFTEYGKTHDGRKLVLMVITNPENHKRLRRIKNQSRQLAKPNSDKVDIENLPAVINMGYGVHGDESSATNCAPLVAYYLAAAQGEEIDRILNDCVILLDPSLNPDGFNRFATWANRYRGRNLNPDPQHAEHHQQWPPGRVNYYWFDLNRDWLPLVHPESRQRMNWYHQWKPSVVLDFHEMGTNSTYFFQPGIPQRTNPLTPAANVELTNKFGEYHAKALDERGSLYFTQEQFDDFYMGKGSTYPDLHGSVGILFEQASSRGHVQTNQDGELTFYETIANHFATSLSSLKATSDLRLELHEHKRKFYSDARQMGASAKKQTFVFSAPHNRSRLQAFAEILIRHDIRCYWLKEPLEYGDRTFDPRWTLVAPTNQSEFRFLKSLLMRRTKFRENVFYDVSSWTLPLAFGIQQTAIKRNLKKEELVPARIYQKMEARFEFADSDVAYLIDWRDDVAQSLLAKLLRQEVTVRVARKEFGYANGEDNVSFEMGTLQVPLGVQPNRRKQIQNILSRGVKSGVNVTAVNSGLTTEGIDLGSNNFPVVKKPRVAMLIGPGVSAYSAGEVWHLLDERVGLPVSMIKTASLARTDLSDYRTFVLPDGSYRSLDADDWAKLKSFASDGGTIISVGSAAGTAASNLSDIENSERVFEAEGSADKDDPKSKTSPIQKPYASASKERALQLISGAIFKTKVDRTHPIGYGLPSNNLAVFRNHARFLNPSENAFSNPVIYDSKGLQMAGYCSKENLEKFAGSASVVIYPVGRGRLILMSDNPNFRGFWRGTSRLFTNAVFFGDMIR